MCIISVMCIMYMIFKIERKVINMELLSDIFVFLYAIFLVLLAIYIITKVICKIINFPLSSVIIMILVKTLILFEKIKTKDTKNENNCNEIKFIKNKNNCDKTTDLSFEKEMKLSKYLFTHTTSYVDDNGFERHSTKKYFLSKKKRILQVVTSYTIDCHSVSNNSHFTYNQYYDFEDFNKILHNINIPEGNVYLGINEENYKQYL